MRILTPSNHNPDDNHTSSNSSLVKPTVTMITQPEAGTIKIYIHSLPRPQPGLRLNQPNSCTLIQIIHSHKRLMSEGDRLGRKEYRRKVKHNRQVSHPDYLGSDQPVPLENNFFRAQVSHVIRYNRQESRLEISFIRSYDSPAYLLAGDTKCQLTDAEAIDFIFHFCQACVDHLQNYLNSAYLNAIYSPSQKIPDFYGLLQTSH